MKLLKISFLIAMVCLANLHGHGQNAKELQKQLLELTKEAEFSMAKLNAQMKLVHSELLKKSIHAHLPSYEDWRNLTVPKLDSIINILAYKGLYINYPSKSNERPIEIAVKICKDEEIVARLIELGADINLPDKNNNTVLMDAASNNPVEVIKLLISAGAKVNVRNKFGYSPFMFSARNNNMNVLQTLKENGAKTENGDYDKMLVTAADKNTNIEMFHYLLENGASINATNRIGNSVIENAIRKNDRSKEIISFLLSKNPDLKYKHKGLTPFLWATRMDNITVDILQLLLDAGSDINELSDDGENAIYSAADGCSLEVVKFLVENGAEVNCVSKSKQYSTLMRAAFNDENPEVIKYLLDNGAKTGLYNKYGGNSLNIAVQQQETKIIEFLIENGEQVNIPKNPPIVTAGKSKNLEIIKTLIKHGADINAKNNKGYTCLHKAIMNDNRYEINKFLVENGAKVNIRNNKEKTPLMLAARYNKVPANIDLLLSNGTKLEMETKTLQLTALTEAAHYNKNVEITKTLIENGADINKASTEGWTPLLYALRYNKNPEVSKLIIMSGADITLKTKKNKWNAIMMAARYSNSVDICKLLIEKGASIKGKKGLSPKDLAKHNENIEVINYFENL